MCLHCQKDVKKESPQLIPCGRSSVIGESNIKRKSKQLCSCGAPILKSPFSPLQLHFTCQQWYLGAPLSHNWGGECFNKTWHLFDVFLSLSNVDYIFVWPKNPDVFLQLWCKLKLKWVFFGGCLGFINRLFPSAKKISTNINPLVHFKSIQEHVRLSMAAIMRFFIHIFTQTNEIWLRLYSDRKQITTKVTGCWWGEGIYLAVK